MGRLTGIVAILGCFVSYKVGAAYGREESERRNLDAYLRGSRGECLRCLKAIDDEIRRRKETAGAPAAEGTDAELAAYRNLEDRIGRILERSESLRTLQRMPWLWETYGKGPDPKDRE